MIERRSAAATLAFKEAGPGLYTIDLQGTPGARGTDLKAAIAAAFGWMFVNTDAMVLRGSIRSDNARCLVLVPHVSGSRLDRGDDVHTFSLTLARWAMAYGITRALSEMHAAGQSAKADKLEAAAKVAGAL